jgi:hypothetical protein
MYLIQIIFLILLLIVFVIWYNRNHIIIRDLKYYLSLLGYKTSSLNNNNKLLIPKREKNRILLVTYDDRSEIPFVIMHNKNLQNYVDQWGYEYKYYDQCIHNAYWCKMFIVLEELNSGKYDYVMWLDSDTIIKNPNINIDDIVNSYSSDIFIGDHYEVYAMGGFNSGVFIIKNSDIGKQFLLDAITIYNNNKQDCVNSDGSLKGLFTGVCYEQSVMNMLIHKNYSKNTTTLSDKFVRNSTKCYDDVFIMHNCGANNENRLKCFMSNNADNIY